MAEDKEEVETKGSRRYRRNTRRMRRKRRGRFHLSKSRKKHMIDTESLEIFCPVLRKLLIIIMNYSIILHHEAFCCCQRRVFTDNLKIKWCVYRLSMRTLDLRSPRWSVKAAASYLLTSFLFDLQQVDLQTLLHLPRLLLSCCLLRTQSGYLKHTAP